MESAAPWFKTGRRWMLEDFVNGRAAYFFIPSPANFLLNFATWPPVSIMR